MTELPQIFISHSSSDRQLAELLVELLGTATGLPKAAVRCTSVDGCKLPGGSHSSTRLRDEIRSARVFIGIVSKISAESHFVLFELGARWGLNQPLIPLLASGTTYAVLPGPLKEHNAHSTTSVPELTQMLEEVSAILPCTLRPVAEYFRLLSAISQLQPDEASATTGVVSTTDIEEAEYNSLEEKLNSIKLKMSAGWAGEYPPEARRVLSRTPGGMNEYDEVSLWSVFTLDSAWFVRGFRRYENPKAVWMYEIVAPRLEVFGLAEQYNDLYKTSKLGKSVLRHFLLTSGG